MKLLLTTLPVDYGGIWRGRAQFKGWGNSVATLAKATQIAALAKAVKFYWAYRAKASALASVSTLAWPRTNMRLDG